VLAKKADLNDLQRVIAALENKIDINSFESLVRAVESKADKQELSYRQHQQRAASPDIDRTLQQFQSEKFDLEKRINE
jgi:hypothetical protein